MKTLIVAEKPSAAKIYADALGRFTKHDGYMENDDYIITWAVGHLIGLCTPEGQNPDWTDKHWEVSQLPMLPNPFHYQIISATKKQYYVIEKLIHRKDVNLLINAGDAGREGEYIQRLIYDMAKSTLPEKRLWTDSMTESEIKRGFQNLLDGKDKYNLYLSAKARAFYDWKIGMNGTRALCLYNKVFGYSVGRVQLVVVRIVADRDKAIQEFKPEPFYQVSIDTNKGYSGLWYTEEDGEKKNSFSKKTDAEAMIRKVDGKSGTIKNTFTVRRTKDRPKFYNLAAVQSDAAKLFGYQLNETLGYVQNLYEKHKLVTYPRTDSRYITKDIARDIPLYIDMIRQHQDLPNEIKKAAELVIQNTINLDKGVVDNSKVTDHHALLITEQFKQYSLNKLSKQEWNVLLLIIKQMLLACSQRYEYDETTIITEVENETFKTTGQTPISYGFMETMKIMNGKMPVTVKTLPAVKKGEMIQVKKTELISKMTNPPEPITNDKLIKIMENVSRLIEDKTLKDALKEKGIGTSATRGSIVDKVFEMGYVEYGSGKNPPIHVTEKGLALLQMTPEKLSSPSLTAEWELKLEQIANGTYSFSQFEKEVDAYVIQMIEDIKNLSQTQNITVKQSSGKEVIGTCPFCGNPVYENQKSFYCSNYKAGCKFSLWKNDKWFEWKGKKVTKTMAKSFLAGKRVHMKGLKKKDGGTYDAYVSIKEWKLPYHEWLLEFK